MERSLARSLSTSETVAAGWFDAEVPRHRAATASFCIDRLPVTQELFAGSIGGPDGSLLQCRQSPDGAQRETRPIDQERRRHDPASGRLRSDRPDLRDRVRGRRAICHADLKLATVSLNGTTLEIDSPADPAQVAPVVRNAERGCFVMQALLNPVPVTGRTVLNGQPLAWS